MTRKWDCRHDETLSHWVARIAVLAAQDADQLLDSPSAPDVIEPNEVLIARKTAKTMINKYRRTASQWKRTLEREKKIK